MKKLIYNTTTNLLQPWPRADGEAVQGLEPHLLEMTVIETETPTIDDTTQRLEFSRSIDVEARTVTQGMVAVDKSAEEIAQERRMKYPDAAKYQVREWLIDQGIDLDSIPAVLATMIPDETALKKAVNRWESVERIPRDHPLVVALGAQLGFTPEQLDVEWPTVLSL